MIKVQGEKLHDVDLTPPQQWVPKAEYDALTAKVAELEKDAARYQHVQHHGFPVKNQTAHTEDYRWVAFVGNKEFYGCTPSFAIDAAIKAAAADTEKQP